MKTAIFTTLVLMMSQAAFSAEEPLKVTLTCTPMTKPAPYKSVEFKIDGDKNISVHGVFTEDAGYAADDDNQFDGDIEQSGDKEGRVFVNKIEGSGSGAKAEIYSIDLNVDINDWAGNHFDIKSDDSGLVAFVDFYSDGPSIRSLYRCEAK